MVIFTRASARQQQYASTTIKEEQVVVAFEDTATAILPTPTKQKQKQQRAPKRKRESSDDTRYGLIQEAISESLYALVIQAILWNQTTGIAARPVLNAILTGYPNPEDLAKADLVTLTAIIQPIGLHNRRAKRLIDLARTWVAAPPVKERRYRKLGYPDKTSGKDVKVGEILDEADPREGWEIAHLPGIGRYALDSYRMFHRDKLRGIDTEKEEPEWKRVTPQDKELRAWLVWRWQKEGYAYNIETGKRKPLAPDTSQE